ncbi:MAG: hypothetical protein AABX03_00355 [Nanoarchaeota archaeon]|mgnify:CR=1 FL=1
MKKRSVLILILALLVPLLVMLIILSQIPKTSPQDQNTLFPCNTLEYNGQDKINLVFFSTKEDAEIYSNELFSFSPLDENKAQFNVYYIDTYLPKCELYKGIAILCYSKENIKIAASCPNDYIIVLKEEDPSIRSSSYMNLLSINKNHPLTVIAHEFGHAFANFAEEYTPSNIPFGSKNCVETCNKFNSLNEGCFEGCSKDSYFRSIDYGIMRTLNSKAYGKFNEKIISERISKSNKITGNIVLETENCNAQKYYLISGFYKQNEIKIINKSLEKGCVGSSGSGPFNYAIQKESGAVIGEGEFNPEFIFTDAQNIQEIQITGGDFESDINFILKIPIIPEASSLNIIKENKTIQVISLLDIGVTLCQV